MVVPFSFRSHAGNWISLWSPHSLRCSRAVPIRCHQFPPSIFQGRNLFTAMWVMSCWSYKIMKRYLSEEKRHRRLDWNHILHHFSMNHSGWRSWNPWSIKGQMTWASIWLLVWHQGVTIRRDVCNIWALEHRPCAPRCCAVTKFSKNGDGHLKKRSSINVIICIK
jgi:hypothetical protein